MSASSSFSSSSNTAADFFGAGWEELGGPTTTSSYNNDTSNESTTIPPPQPEVINPLTDTQEMVMSILFVISGMLSIIGSTTIVVKIIRNSLRSKISSTTTTTTTPYDRIMLGLSSCDIIASLSWILTPFLIPSSESQNSNSSRVWAIGNDSTCTLLGTLSQFGFCAVVYNLVLSCYYLLTVKFGIKRKTFAQRYEPWIHIVPLTYFFVTAIVGGIVGVYSEVDLGMGCWVNDFPKGCDLDPGIDCTSATIGWAFGAGPTILTFVVLIINNIVIYLHVKNKLGGVGNFKTTTIIPNKSNSNKNNTTTKTADAHTSSNNGDDDIINNNNSNKPSIATVTAPTTTSTSTTSINKRENSTTTTTSTTAIIESLTTTTTAPNIVEQDEDMDNISLDTTTDNEEEEESTRLLQYKHQRYIREVATQGFLYVGTFFVAYTPAFVLRAIEVYGTYPIEEQPLFPLFVLVSILLPLQGFFNMFVYNRPNYIRIRQAYPEYGILWAIKMACLDSNIPRLSTGGGTGTGVGMGGNTDCGGSASNNRMKRRSKSNVSGGSGRFAAATAGNNNAGIPAVNNSNNRVAANYNYYKRTSSSGKNFSSGLQVVRECSQEEGYDDLMGSSNSSSSGGGNENNEVCVTSRDHDNDKKEIDDNCDVVDDEDMKLTMDGTGITAKMEFDYDDEDDDDIVDNCSIGEYDDDREVEKSSITQVPNDNGRERTANCERIISNHDYDEENQVQETSSTRGNPERSNKVETIQRNGSTGKMISFDGSIFDTSYSTTTVDA